MEHAQALRFVDLTATEPDDASLKLKQRRALLRNAGLAAFAASTTGAAFAQTVDRYASPAARSRKRSIATRPARRRCATRSPT